MGKPPGGFPKKVRDRILRGEPALRGRPGATLPPVDFNESRKEVEAFLGREPLPREVVSYILYPKVYRDFADHQLEYGDVSNLPTPVFFYGLKANEEIAVDIEHGKTLIIKYLTKSAPDADGRVTVFFELNGQPREITIVDRSLESSQPKRGEGGCRGQQADRREHARNGGERGGQGRRHHHQGPEATGAGSDEDGIDHLRGSGWKGR